MLRLGVPACLGLTLAIGCSGSEMVTGPGINAPGFTFDHVDATGLAEFLGSLMKHLAS